MKIENLKIFLEVAQSESINEAARNLFMTHQNLNKIIKNLESELNTQLFVRTNKGIQLTANGKELFVTASQIVRNYDSFLEKLQNTNSNIIKFYTIPSQSMLAEKIQGTPFGQQYLSVYKRDFDEIIKMVQRGKNGIYFLPVASEVIETCPDTTTHIITSSDIVIYACHKDHIQQYKNKDIAMLNRWISNTSKDGFEGFAMNIDDIHLRKRLMREEGFAYSTEYNLFGAEFPEEEWVIFHQESVPDYHVTYTLFFNLPNTLEFQQLQQNIIKTVESFFLIGNSDKSIYATL